MKIAIALKGAKRSATTGNLSMVEGWVFVSEADLR